MPEIVDHLGRSIKTSELTKKLAVPTVSGVRSVWYDSIASTLTPERLATIIVEVDQNDILNYLTLAEEMEERDLHYRSVLSTRKLAVSGLDAVVEAYSDDAKDVEIADFVRDVVTDEAFVGLVKGQLDAIGKGYSVSEIMWLRPEWIPCEYKWRDPRWFQFDTKTGSELRLRDDEFPIDGRPLAPYKFCVHRPQLKLGLAIRSGLARLVAVAFMCKGYTLKDWMAFAEVFGMPLRLGKYDRTASSDQKAALLRAVTNIGTDAAATIPDSMLIEFIEASKTAGGEKLFLGLAEYLDKQVSKGVLGQTATVEGTVGKLGAEDAQEQVREDIRKDDATQLATTIRRDVIRPLVDLSRYGPQPRGHYPKLRLFTEEPEDLEKLAKSLPEFIDRGLTVELSVMRDKFNLPEPAEGAEVLTPKSGAGAGAVPAPPGESELEEPPESMPVPDELEQEQRETTREIMGMMRRGETLTADQRILLVATVAARQSTIVQSLILSKTHFKTREAAKGWVTEHKYHAAKIDETENTWRLRQREPGEFKEGSLRTIKMTEGVKAVIGRLKTATAAAEPTGGEDEIDRLAEDALGDWQKMMDPVLQPILEHAKASDGYEDFLEGLEGVMAGVDSTEFAERLAVATFKARGLGDGTDDIT